LCIRLMRRFLLMNMKKHMQTQITAVLLSIFALSLPLFGQDEPVKRSHYANIYFNEEDSSYTARISAAVINYKNVKGNL